MPIKHQNIVYMTQDEVAAAVGKSSAWVRNIIKTRPDLLPVYKGDRQGKGKRNLFLPKDVENLKKKLAPRLFVPGQEEEDIEVEGETELPASETMEFDDEDDLFTLEEIAKHFKMSYEYILKRVQNGHIVVVNLALPGALRPLYRVTREEFDYIRTHGWRLPKKEQDAS